MQALAARRGRLLDYLIALPRLAEPGARWSYSTTGYLLLACILERAGGAAFGAVMETTLLRPLGLADTGEDDPGRINPGRALGHVRGRDGSWRNAPNDALAEADGPRELYSTAADLDRWGCAIMAGEVLSPDGAALTFTPHAHVGPGSDFDPSLDYGYGWFPRSRLPLDRRHDRRLPRGDVAISGRAAERGHAVEQRAGRLAGPVPRPGPHPARLIRAGR